MKHLFVFVLAIITKVEIRAETAQMKKQKEDVSSREVIITGALTKRNRKIAPRSTEQERDIS